MEQRGPGALVMAELVCANCAFPDEDLVLVRRLYLSPGDGEPRVVDEAELWCVSCCTQYPNEPVDS